MLAILISTALIGCGGDSSGGTVENDTTDNSSAAVESNINSLRDINTQFLNEGPFIYTSNAGDISIERLFNGATIFSNPTSGEEFIVEDEDGVITFSFEGGSLKASNDKIEIFSENTQETFIFPANLQEHLGNTNSIQVTENKKLSNERADSDLYRHPDAGFVKAQIIDSKTKEDITDNFQLRVVPDGLNGAISIPMLSQLGVPYKISSKAVYRGQEFWNTRREELKEYFKTQCDKVKQETSLTIIEKGIFAIEGAYVAIASYILPEKIVNAIGDIRTILYAVRTFESGDPDRIINDLCNQKHGDVYDTFTEFVTPEQAATVVSELGERLLNWKNGSENLNISFEFGHSFSHGNKYIYPTTFVHNTELVDTPVYQLGIDPPEDILFHVSDIPDSLLQRAAELNAEKARTDAAAKETLKVSVFSVKTNASLTQNEAKNTKEISGQIEVTSTGDNYSSLKYISSKNVDENGFLKVDIPAGVAGVRDTVLITQDKPEKRTTILYIEYFQPVSKCPTVSAPLSTSMTYSEALQACASYNTRLPTKGELISIGGGTSLSDSCGWDSNHWWTSENSGNFAVAVNGVMDDLSTLWRKDRKMGVVCMSK